MLIVTALGAVILLSWRCLKHFVDKTNFFSLAVVMTKPFCFSFLRPKLNEKERGPVVVFLPLSLRCRMIIQVEAKNIKYQANHQNRSSETKKKAKKCNCWRCVRKRVLCRTRLLACKKAQSPTKRLPTATLHALSRYFFIPPFVSVGSISKLSLQPFLGQSHFFRFHYFDHLPG